MSDDLEFSKSVKTSVICGQFKDHDIHRMTKFSELVK